ncbi:MAG TPA: tRNA pseudouridine(55) synthase TruB [Vicinamibacteria bacterium]|nr:tRNA pseudouridine(55) synthase TruB [Vicinamibacteria bacterium]
MDGVLVVDKPAGPTSHDVVERVRQVLRVRRAGHTGTLDPFATGVLPICVGKATRLARFLSEGDKAYRATVRLGFATTTDDLTGEPVGIRRAVDADEAVVRRACVALTGALRQVPPAYSAKRVEGQRLYDLARRGVAVERAAVPVTVHALDVVSVEGDHVVLDVRCSAGTYVRALARDLGEALGAGAHLAALRRTEAAGLGLAGAVAWGDLAPAAAERVLPLDVLLPQFPAVVVGEEGAAAVRHGRDLDRRLVTHGFPVPPAPARVRVLDAQGRLLALAVPRGFGPPVPGLPAVPDLHPDVVLAG